MEKAKDCLFAGACKQCEEIIPKPRRFSHAITDTTDKTVAEAAKDEITTRFEKRFGGGANLKFQIDMI